MLGCKADFACTYPTNVGPPTQRSRKGSGTAPRSAPSDADDSDVGNLLVDEVGDSDPRWELILVQLHASHDLPSRARRSTRNPSEQLLGEQVAISWWEGIEVRLGRVGQEDPPRHAERLREPLRYSASSSLSEKP